MKTLLSFILAVLFIEQSQSAVQERIFRDYIRDIQLEKDELSNLTYEQKALLSMEDSYIKHLQSQTTDAVIATLYYGYILASQNIGYRLGSKFYNHLNLPLEQLELNHFRKIRNLDCSGFISFLFKLLAARTGDDSFDLGSVLNNEGLEIELFTQGMIESVYRPDATAALQSRYYKNFDVYISRFHPRARRFQASRDDKAVVTHNGFRPQAGDLLVYNRFGRGHVVMVIDPDQCIALNSSSHVVNDRQGYDPTIRGVRFHKVDESRCKDGIWSSWDSSRNRWQALYRHKKFVPWMDQSYEARLSQAQSDLPYHILLSPALTQEYYDALNLRNFPYTGF